MVLHGHFTCYRIDTVNLLAEQQHPNGIVTVTTCPTPVR